MKPSKPSTDEYARVPLYPENPLPKSGTSNYVEVPLHPSTHPLPLQIDTFKGAPHAEFFIMEKSSSRIAITRWVYHPILLYFFFFCPRSLYFDSKESRHLVG